MAYGSTLHVSGFPRGVRTRDLAPDFESIGRVVRIEMPPARSEFARPFAFVEYETPEEAQDALNQLNQRPLSFDSQISLSVQFARSEARPSRYSDPSDRRSTRGGPLRQEHAHSRGAGAYGSEFAPDDDRYDRRRSRDSYEDDEFHARGRSYNEDSTRSRGTYGPRSYRGHRGLDYAAPKRELSPARVRADDGPAPYQDVLHNNAAALKKPRYEGSREKREEQDEYIPEESKDVDMTSQTATEAPSTLVSSDVPTETVEQKQPVESTSGDVGFSTGETAPIPAPPAPPVSSEAPSAPPAPTETNQMMPSPEVSADAAVAADLTSAASKVSPTENQASVPEHTEANETTPAVQTENSHESTNASGELPGSH
ncbi:LANO_0H17062g1_1 [Lachancea nothofagi CBS 11611]|uniref:LANO_0H17062g1_1 n=1 Tax=Lachancea nothofagi CBS 11611 TaxID=1266666 RepID=A0A1G4KMY4_9SACH|nr:LANO_0H17062g1_1 [Lachancea nothofagi CBS 11611]